MEEGNPIRHRRDSEPLTVLRTQSTLRNNTLLSEWS
jgi:hypothetical protein